jgi:hypothetical protein
MLTIPVLKPQTVRAYSRKQSVEQHAFPCAGLVANLYRRTATAKDACRFRVFEDLILRLLSALTWASSPYNEAQRTIQPAKVQQRSSGGCWVTLTGLAEFALLQSYLSTAAKWTSANSTASAAC